MKENRKRWVPLLTCGLLCALLLSGCSGMMQALADGTDTVLGGLSMPDGIGAWRGIELLRWLGALPRVVETGPRLYQPIHLDQRQ